MKQKLLFKKITFSFYKRIFIAIVAVLFAGQVFSQQNDVTTITISKARQTDYVKDKETENDCILLSGDVQLSVSKGSSSSEISADSVTYDRKTAMLYAEGNVKIITKGGSSGEQNISANSLIMNTSTLEGVFDGGKVIQTQSDAINLPAGSTLVVFSDVFGKSDNNTIAFKNSSLTFCDDDNPHWHIDATRTWLLPGGEFAFFNALLYVGPVPVMYFPAFYYPKDELIFNPNFGYRQKEGYYFQTTTYLYGRKPLASNSEKRDSDSDDSMKDIYNFMKSNSLKQQERQGLILHNLDENYSGDTTHYIKLMADWYSNLGGMIGVDGKINPSKVSFISDLDFNLSLGFGYKLNSSGGLYTPFNQNMETELYKTNFLGMELPFRYKGNLNLTITKPFSIKISFPLYSDPDFASDFDNRNENMDWISLLTNFGNEEEGAGNSVTSYSWKISASYNIPISQNIKPYITTASVQAAADMNFNSRKDFFYPFMVTPINVNGNLSGTLYKYPADKKSQKEENFVTELILPNDILSEKASESSENNENNKNNENKEEIENEIQNEINFTFPEINPVIASYDLPAGINYNLNYNFTPNYINQITFAVDKINNPSDFQWTNLKSAMYTIKAPLTVNSNLSYGRDLFTLKNSISYTPVWQHHTSTAGLSDSEKNSVLLSDYKAENQTVVSKNTIGVKPFAYLPYFSQSSITYETNINLFRKQFTGTAENPEWKYFGPDWTDDESVTTHNLSVSLVTSQKDNSFKQNLVLTSSLYPQLPKLSGTLNLTFPYVTTSISTGISQKSKTDNSWKKNPFVQNLSVSLFDSKLSFSENFNYNLEENHVDSLRFSTKYKNFSAAYSMLYTNKYDFDSSQGWIINNKEKDLIPYSLSMNYSYKPETFYYWFNRISVAPGLETSLTADLVRPTNSYFIFTPSLSFKINEFLTITFSSTSRNSVLYRYVQGFLGYEGRIPGEENPFVDLFDSFRFDNKVKRENSGWKLKSLNLAVTHQLHDWDFNMTLKIEPRLITSENKKTYSYNPYFSIGVTWKPMESMKTSVTDEYGTWKFE